MPVLGTDDDGASYDHSQNDDFFLDFAREAHAALGEFESANELFLQDRQSTIAVNDAALKAGHAIASIVSSLVGMVSGHLEARGAVPDPDGVRASLGQAISGGFLSASDFRGSDNPFVDVIPPVIISAVRARIGSPT